MAEDEKEEDEEDEDDDDFFDLDDDEQDEDEPEYFTCRVCKEQTDIDEGDDMILLCDKCAERYDIDKLWNDFDHELILEENLKTFDLNKYLLKPVNCGLCGEPINLVNGEKLYKSEDGLYKICFTCKENEKNKKLM